MSARGKEGERKGTGRGCKRAGEGGKRIRGKRDREELRKRIK